MKNYFNKYLKYKLKYLNLKKQLGGEVFIHKNIDIDIKSYVSGKLNPIYEDFSFFMDRVGCLSLKHNMKSWENLSEYLSKTCKRKVDIKLFCLSEDLCPTQYHKNEKTNMFVELPDTYKIDIDIDKIRSVKENKLDLLKLDAEKNEIGINLLLSCNSGEVAHRINKHMAENKITNNPVIGFSSNVHIVNNIIVSSIDGIRDTLEPSLEYSNLLKILNNLNDHKNKLLDNLLKKKKLVYLPYETIKNKFEAIISNFVNNNSVLSENGSEFKCPIKKEDGTINYRDFKVFEGTFEDLKKLENYDESGIINIMKPFDEYKKEYENEGVEINNFFDNYELMNSIIGKIIKSKYGINSSLKKDKFEEFIINLRLKFYKLKPIYEDLISSEKKNYENSFLYRYLYLRECHYIRILNVDLDEDNRREGLEIDNFLDYDDKIDNSEINNILNNYELINTIIGKIIKKKYNIKCSLKKDKFEEFQTNILKKIINSCDDYFYKLKPYINNSNVIWSELYDIISIKNKKNYGDLIIDEYIEEIKE